MKSKVLVKIALMILMTIIIISNCTICLADNFDFSGFDSKSADATLADPVKEGMGAVLNVVRIAGTGVAIIILAYIGMKYMIAAPGDRADLKKSAVQYVIGAIVVFGASNILALLIPVFENVMPSA